MLKHIVMWQFAEQAEGQDKAANLAQARALLQGCVGLVPGQGRLEVAAAAPGLECTYDLVLYSEFADRAALDAYQNHPRHVALKPFIGAARLERRRGRSVWHAASEDGIICGSLPERWPSG